MSTLRYILFLLAALLGTNQSVPAQSLAVWAEDYPPYGYMEQGVIKGMSADIVHSLVEDSGIQVSSWTMAPWARAYNMVLTHPNTLLYTVTRSSERESLFYWVGPISNRKISLYKLKSRPDIVVRSLEDAKKYRVGAVIGTASFNQMKDLGFTIDPINDHDLSMLKLINGRVDLIPFQDYSLAYLAQKRGMKYADFENVVQLDNSQQYYFAINKETSPEIVAALQKSFRKLEDSGKLKGIQHKYLR